MFNNIGKMLNLPKGQIDYSHAINSPEKLIEQFQKGAIETIIKTNKLTLGAQVTEVKDEKQIEKIKELQDLKKGK